MRFTYPISQIWLKLRKQAGYMTAILIRYVRLILLAFSGASMYDNTSIPTRKRLGGLMQFYSREAA